VKFTNRVFRHCAAVASLALIHGPLFAQQAPAPAAAPEAELQEVVVTGSRIPVPANISATSPTTIVSAQEIQLQGHTDISDVINALPQNIITAANDFGNTSSPLTGTGGFSTVDLRGIGPQRTLVLVDGRRLGAGDPSTTNQAVAPDIDQIPAPLIERVDVVTGGASATYGSDAIAGVVNFILKKDFQGVQIDGQYGFSQHDEHNGYVEDLVTHDDPLTSYTANPVATGSVRDGYKHDLSMIMGTNFAEDKGNVTGYFVYHDQQPVSAAARDFSGCQLYSNGDVASKSYTGVECVGSENSNYFKQQTIGSANLGKEYTVVGNQFLPWPQVGSTPPAIYDFNQFEYLQREDKRYQAGFLGHLDINDNVKPYVEFGWMDDRTVAVVAPSALFIGGNSQTADGNELVNCSNPLLSPQQRAILCTPAQIAGDLANPGSKGNSADVQIGRRNIEGGGRTAFYEHNNFRLVVGADGAIFDGWTYDLYGSYYYVTTFQDNTNYINYANADNALQVTTNGGKPVCISGAQCVPWNIFKTGGVTAAQLAYLETPGTAEGNNTEQIAHVDITGELGRYGLQSPWTSDGVAVNFGGEHRMDSVAFNPDAIEMSGQLSGLSGALVPISESYDIDEAFVEARLPIAHDLPAVYDLTADTGYRYSNYSTTGSTNTYKFEVQYAPIQDARLRFSFDRAVRAPNLIELFLPASYGNENVFGSDPCAGAPAASLLVPCERTGVTAAQFAINPKTGVNSITQCVSGQCGESIQGNSHLQPEVAKTWSLGLSFTPVELPGFTASVDYYHIRLENEIGTYPFANIFNGCFNGTNPFYCTQIVRTPQGALTGATVAGGGYFIQKDYNLGLLGLSGIDLQMNYRHALPAGWGTFSVAMNGAYLLHDTLQPFPGAGSYDCAGLFGSTCEAQQGSVNPHWRHTLRFNWDTPWDLLLSLQWRFIGPTSFDNNSTNPLLQGAEEAPQLPAAPPPYYDQYNARIPGYSYLDLTAVWHALSNLELRAGVTNLLDKDPPLVPSTDISGNSGPANSYPTYDYLGRQLFVAFTAKF
jgi:iron complex outermembrane recepter protein